MSKYIKMQVVGGGKSWLYIYKLTLLTINVLYLRITIYHIS